MKTLNRQISAIAGIMTAIVLAVTPWVVNAQSIYKLSPAGGASIKVSGSSNLHDWTMVSNSTMESQGEFKFDAGNQLLSLASFTFTVNAKSLKSGHDLMDSRTYAAIKAGKFPLITYRLSSAEIRQEQKDKYLIKAIGDLTIAGVTRPITMYVNANVNPDNTISCSGLEKLKLTDFKIDPPTFMFGALKVTNDLTIQFELQYKNNQLLTKN
ncbi:MAG TPA: YceI family protein [Mucilaginibacter sp.]|nr:YceI family protein [Mucilaginibacter sp.]